MSDRPKPPPEDMTRKLAEQVRRENHEGKREPDPAGTRRIAEGKAK